MDWALCGERDRLGKEASWRRRGSDQAEAGRYRRSWKRGIEDQTAWKIIPRETGCYLRRCDQYRKFQWWRWGGRWGSRRDRVVPAQRKWRTWLGDGHNLHNSAAGHGQVSAEADEATWCDRSGIRGRSRLLPAKRQDVWHIAIQDSWRCSAANGWWCSGTCTQN